MYIYFLNDSWMWPGTPSFAKFLINACAMTHTHIHDSYDSFIYVPWLYMPDERPVTRSYATCLIHICAMTHMTHSHMCHDCICHMNDPWLLDIHITHSYMCHDSYDSSFHRIMGHIMDLNATWLIRDEKARIAYTHTWFIHTYMMHTHIHDSYTHTHIHDSFICVP